MALATPTITVIDGSGNSTTNVSAGANAFITPGNAITLGLQSTTGVQTAQFVLTSPDPRMNGIVSPLMTGNGPFTWTFTAPSYSTTWTVITQVTDGNAPSYNTNTMSCLQRVAGLVHRARGVQTSNVANLAAFTGVSGGSAVDGVTYAQGEIVLLVGQTSKAQNGLYQVGVVAAGSAPLTRPADWATGTIFLGGQPQVVEVAEGTLFANTTWKVTTTGALTVDTTAFDMFPRQVTQSVTLVAGTVTVTNVPILSATKSNFLACRTTANTSTATTGGYHPVGAVTPGVVGTASLVFDATVAAGTINNADISTLSLTIINW